MAAHAGVDMMGDVWGLTDDEKKIYTIDTAEEARIAVRAYKTKCSLTQKEFAERIGAPVQKLSQFMNMTGEFTSDEANMKTDFFYCLQFFFNRYTYHARLANENPYFRRDDLLM